MHIKWQHYTCTSNKYKWKIIQISNHPHTDSQGVTEGQIWESTRAIKTFKTFQFLSTSFKYIVKYKAIQCHENKQSKMGNL